MNAREGRVRALTVASVGIDAPVVLCGASDAEKGDLYANVDDLILMLSSAQQMWEADNEMEAASAIENVLEALSDWARQQRGQDPAPGAGEQEETHGD